MANNPLFISFISSAHTLVCCQRQPHFFTFPRHCYCWLFHALSLPAHFYAHFMFVFVWKEKPSLPKIKERRQKKVQNKGGNIFMIPTDSPNHSLPCNCFAHRTLT